ncbi:MAG: NRDE family protein [Nitritalea sp.]
MCLIGFKWRNHPGHSLVLVGNRDEFFDRPTQALHRWPSGMYAGKDLKAGGTWMGFHPNGRFGFLTNYRDLRRPVQDALTRGDLVRDFVEGTLAPEAYLQRIAQRQERYEGFNLIVGTPEGLYYFSNYGSEIQRLAPGTYGLSNGLLNNSWSKVTQLQQDLEALPEEVYLEDLLQLAGGQNLDPDALLPDTGASLHQERQLSAQFIRLDDYYGTVSTTALLWRQDGQVELVERAFLAQQTRIQEVSIRFQVEKSPS